LPLPAKLVSSAQALPLVAVSLSFFFSSMFHLTTEEEDGMQG